MKAFAFIKLLAILSIIMLLGCSVPESSPASRVKLSESGVYAADISRDGTKAIISEVNGAIRVWDLNNDVPLYLWQHQGDERNLVDNVRFSPDDAFAITSDSEAFALWSLENGEPLGFWRIDESSIQDIALSNSASSVLIARSNGQVMYFEPQTQRRLEFLGHGEDKVNSVDLSANGKYALTGGNDYKAYLWSTETGQVIHVFQHPQRVTRVKLDQQARYAFTADGQNDAQIWDVQTGKAVSQLKFIERQIIFTSAEFSDDGKYLLTGSPSKRLMLWDVESGESVQQWRVKPSDGPAPQSAVVYAVGFDHGSTEETKRFASSISSAGNFAKWDISSQDVRGHK
uniref:WD40 repeat domain-containing protein n=1 Tax=Ningiella ruwaisensis TaxID=2364274 RepID=UPI001F4FFEBA|nr:hypothetical protein [Ningiella ruwaisensis]